MQSMLTHSLNSLLSMLFLHNLFTRKLPAYRTHGSQLKLSLPLIVKFCNDALHYKVHWVYIIVLS